MRKDKYISFFKQKGYCIIKEYDEKWDKIEYVKSQKEMIKQVEEELSSPRLGSLTFFDDRDEEYPNNIVFYDNERVEISFIRSLKDFVERILNIDFPSDSYTFYRGHASWKYLMQPSLYREGNENILKNEDKMFRDIVSSKPHFFDDCTTTLEKLVKMQHHGLPTRLLDLTENPLIALFFACTSNEKEEVHGEVNVFRVPEYKLKYYDSDTVSVLSNLAKSPISIDVSGFDFRTYENNFVLQSVDSFNKKLKSQIEKFNVIEDILKLVHNIREDKPYFLNRVHPRHLKNCSIVVKPKMTIDRIVNQSGAFVLFGINKTKEKCADLDINVNGYKQKIMIIPSVYKVEILKQLKLFNINDSTVFCDLDSTAKFFKEKYK